MTLNDYQEQALSTAVYGSGSKIIYPTLGLAGEAGEVDEVPWGIIDETIELMSVQNNGGQQTAELLTYPNQDMIWTNIKETNG